MESLSLLMHNTLSSSYYIFENVLQMPSLHYHKGLALFQSYQQLTSLLVTPPDRTLFMKNENRLLEMRI